MGKPETASVRRTDGVAPEKTVPNVPSQLVRPTSFTKHIREILHADPFVKIIDFGESFQMPNTPTRLHTPLVVRAPECLFSDRLDHRVDLWSMACLVKLSFEFYKTVYTDMYSCSNWSLASHPSIQ